MSRFDVNSAPPLPDPTPVPSGSTPPPSDSSRPVSLLLGLGAAAYTAWVVEVLVWTGLNPINTYVSELAAADQPLGGLFRATDLVAGTLLFLGALWALLRTPRRPWLVTGWAGLALFGAATVADSRLPLSCAPTIDPECAARETAGLVPATHAAHAWSSSLAMLGALSGVVALTVAARRYRHWTPLLRSGPLLAGLVLAATAWTLTSVALFQAGRGTWALGAGQRLQVLLVAIWLAVLAYSVRREKLSP
ncbi:hypothetical protein GCM10010329_14290 [Streptomyces spiroverticillatus]|uniref:DUF998 domain-containing protein n=1 Tax=Streptomyces finlayi TaxID=67296 RepID=A0A918X2Y9_9ACTN|nr:DUF998 domain-containing protein [Streptomyces finlayi]GGZ94207.1 hypothetical protein GCM10010329_14290 [Streptomyces spiroverticillatus]GHD06635.1 hypothetical protein GCM10010334_58320 [Streptomyces finlayi]